jgi:hypothetical protein
MQQPLYHAVFRSLLFGVLLLLFLKITGLFMIDGQVSVISSL